MVFRLLLVNYIYIHTHTCICTIKHHCFLFFFCFFFLLVEEVFLRVGHEGEEVRVSKVDVETDEEKEDREKSLRNLYGATTDDEGGGDKKSYKSVPIDANSDFEVEQEEDMSSLAVFVRHVRALLIKRYKNARRDKKVW